MKQRNAEDKLSKRDYIIEVKYRRNLVHIKPFSNENQRETTSDSLNKLIQENTLSANLSSNSIKDTTIDSLKQTHEGNNKKEETNSGERRHPDVRIQQHTEHRLSNYQNNLAEEDKKEPQAYVRPKKNRKMPKSLNDYVLRLGLDNNFKIRIFFSFIG